MRPSYPKTKNKRSSNGLTKISIFKEKEKNKNKIAQNFCVKLHRKQTPKKYKNQRKKSFFEQLIKAEPKLPYLAENCVSVVLNGLKS